MTDDLAEIEESLKAKCRSCDGSGSEFDDDEKAIWCFNCAGTGLREYDDMPQRHPEWYKAKDIAADRWKDGEVPPYPRLKHGEY